MAADYEIVKYRREDKQGVAALQTRLWSGDTRLNARYFEWKYERDAHVRGPLVYLALHRGTPVGMRGFHEARLEAGTPGRAYPVLIAGDAFIEPAHRNRGLVTRIMRAAYADLADSGCSYFVSLGGASRINALGLMTLGWKSSGGLQPMGRVTSSAARSLAIRRLTARLPVLWRFSEARLLYAADQRNPFRHLDAAIGVAACGSDSPITLAKDPRVEAMVELIRRRGHDGRIRYVRDRDYLTWRFRNPLSDYRFLYWGDERLDGYLVLSRKVGDIGSFYRVYVADLEANSMQIRSKLLAAAIRWGRFPELATWTASLSSEELRALQDQGFAPVDPEDTVRGGPSVMVRPLEDHAPATEWRLGDAHVLDTRNWDVRLLYSMRG